ncbi:MAG: toll/interleukin-1 receptor domain-containing protein [Bacteroidia bacterium]|nr:toll/interleukin-1 receptor domain-containing protein [Bacteroidia bacterium]
MKIYFAHPKTEEFEDVSKSIRQAVERAGHIFIANEEKGDSLTRNQIEANIRMADFMIADVSQASSNVFFEVGFAHGLEIPILLINQMDTNIDFDPLKFQTHYYDREKLYDTLISNLTKIIARDDFRLFMKREIAKFEEERKRKKTVFVSYSRNDMDFLERLKVHLKPYEKKGIIDLWSDTKVNAGEKWKEKITEALNKAAIAILLVSADFLASDFIVDNELPPLLKASQEKGTKILPVYIKPCSLVGQENISAFLGINDPRVPLSKLDINGREEKFVEIVNAIHNLLK